MDLKELLLKDLSARLPYGVICKWENDGYSGGGKLIDVCKVKTSKGYIYWDCYFEDENDDIPIEIVKPYLRSLSSMTEEERKELELLVAIEVDNAENEDEDASEWCLYDRTGILNAMGGARFYFDEMIHVYDWLYQHHFDFRGLISLGLAIEAPKGMY